ncbi:MAG: hypothetical protein KGZ83_08630 [Sulfuricella sp.]|nr:hypothetical protein [Sulfuricella sp.]
MIKHTAIKAGIGLGLMAASMGVSADLHSFGKSSIYYKVSGTRVDYAAFLPSGNQATDTVIMLDVLQSSTISTWNYAVGGALGAPVSSTNTGSVSTSANWIGSYSGTAGGQVWRGTGVLSSFDAQAVMGTVSVSTYYGGDTRALSLSFTELVTASSQACNMTFSAQFNTDDYLQFTNLTISPSGWPAATGNVVWRTKSGTSASDTASIDSAVFNAYNAVSTSSFATFSAWTIPIAGNATNTVAVSAISAPFGKCNAAYAMRTDTNKAGSTIGGKGGMMKLW